jgi:hypothetical protein
MYDDLKEKHSLISCELLSWTFRENPGTLSVWTALNPEKVIENGI